MTMKKQGFKKTMKQGQGGFTMIEMMIVVAIIEVLAAIALPRYLDYTNRAKASEMIMAASSSRTCVTEAAQLGKDPSTCTPEVGDYETTYVSLITVDGEGLITI